MLIRFLLQLLHLINWTWTHEHEQEHEHEHEHEHADIDISHIPDDYDLSQGGIIRIVKIGE